MRRQLKTKVASLKQRVEALDKTLPKRSDEDKAYSRPLRYGNGIQLEGYPSIEAL